MNYHINKDNIAEFVTRKLTLPDNTTVGDTRFSKFIGIIDDLKQSFQNPRRHVEYSRAWVHELFVHIVRNGVFNNTAFIDILYQLFIVLRPIGMNGITQDIFNKIKSTMDKHMRDLNAKVDDRSKLELCVLHYLYYLNQASVNNLFSGLFYGFRLNATVDELIVTPLFANHGIIGINFNLDKWAWSIVKDLATMERNKDQSTIAEFNKLFDQVSKTKSATPNVGFTFINKGGILHKKFDDPTKLDKPYDYETILKNKDEIVKDFCSAAQLGDNTDNKCTDLLNQCGNINNGQQCKDFMDRLAEPNFTAKMQGLKMVDPLIIKRVITMFKWPKRFDTSDKLYKLESPLAWMNPAKQTDLASQANMKLLNENKNLVAFFDAIKSTTDAFPAILNPGYEGAASSTSTFNVNVSESKLGKMGLKPLLHTNKLIVHQSLASLLQFKNMIQGHYGKLAVKFGMQNLAGINLGAFGISLQDGGASQEGGNAVSDVVRTIKKSTGNEDYVHTADALDKLWKLLMNNLSQNHGMDVSAINENVTTYLTKLKSLQEKTLYAIAYVKVFTDELRRRVALGSDDIPTTFDPVNLEKLVNARNALVGKSYTKDMGLIDTLEALLVKLKANL